MASETVHYSSQNVQLLRQALVSEETYATTLLMILIDYYGLEKKSPEDTTFVEWHPETLKDEIEKDFGVELPQLNFDKIMAGITVLTTNLFYKDVQAFIHICNVFSGSPLNPTVFDPADPYECAWGMSEAMLLDPPDEEEPFADVIRGYLGQVLKEWGFITAPDILGIALDANWTEQVTYSFSNDPTMFSAIYDTQNGKTEEVNSTIRENLTELFQQLRSIPIQNGNVAEIEKRIFEKGEMNETSNPI